MIVVPSKRMRRRSPPPRYDNAVSGGGVAVAVVVQVVVAGLHPPQSIPPGRHQGTPCALLHPCGGSTQEGGE